MKSLYDFQKQLVNNKCEKHFPRENFPCDIYMSIRFARNVY